MPSEQLDRTFMDSFGKACFLRMNKAKSPDIFTPGLLVGLNIKRTTLKRLGRLPV